MTAAAAGLVVLLLSTAGCAKRQAGAQNGLSVFVGIPPVADLVKRVGGDNVEVGVLLPKGQNPHSFTPTPRQMAACSEAELYFRTGIELEQAVLPKLRSLRSDILIVDLRRGIRMRSMESAHYHHDTKEDSHRHEQTDHAPGSEDPHIWLSPLNAAIMVETIRDALTHVSPADSARFAANSIRLRAELDSLHQVIAELLSPLRGGKILVFHPSFGYFTDAYGLHQEAVEMGGKEPSARQLAELIEQAQTEGIKVVFVQPQFSQRAAHAVAEAIGGVVIPIDPLAENYVEGLSTMAEQIRSALVPTQTPGNRRP